MDRKSGKTGLVEYAAGTTIGSRRQANEDAFGVYEESQLFVVADGAGGVGFTGATSAKLAVEAFSAFSRDAETAPLGPPNADPLVRSILHADAAVRRLIEEDPRAEGTSAALVAGQVSKSWARIVHLGDCRAGKVHDNALTWLTEDHSLPAAMRRSGASAEEIKQVAPYHSTVITRVLGPLGAGGIDVTYQPVESGDIVLLCSDGLFRQVEHSAIARLAGNKSRQLMERCSDLLDETEKAGGKDNATVILVEVQ